MSLLALSYARLSDPSRDPVFDRIVASLTPRMNRIDDGHTLSLLACAFSRATVRQAQPEELEDAGEKEESIQPLFLPEADGECSHLAFIEMLLEQCQRHILAFRGSDVLHLCLALANLTRTGQGDVIPPRLLPRLAKRLDALYYELLPGQFVRFLELFPYLPELEESCGPRILDELAYRAREVMPRSCLPMLRAAFRLKHARGQSIAAWRLTRSDAKSTFLTPAETCEVASMLVQVAVPQRLPAVHADTGEAPQNLLWEAREALLIMLQGLKQRNVEPKPSALCSLLDSAALLSVRDTQWFYLCQKLLAHQPILAKRSLGSPESLGESFDEADLAKATLALARLSFPQLIDAGSMFSRAAAVRSPQAASAVLEAAAIFALTERKPQDLSAAKLSPLVLAVDGGLRSQDEKEAWGCEWTFLPKSITRAETLPRLFPFSGILAAQAADPEVLARWRSAVSTATAMAAASRGASPHFQDLVLQELSTWEVGLETDVVVGPMTVPFALSLVELASFVRRQRTADSDSDMEDGSAPEAEAKSTLQAKRLARRKRQAAAPRKQDTFIAEDEISLASLSSEARPETHILIDLLTDVDFYHASPSQGERRTGRQLSSERRAELQLLRRLGWHVVCVPEHSWQLHGDSEAAEANREMIFKLVADTG
ncbi:unnamed protein product [Effrenium voratum]|nr:unnamed protein product [Effrenium voratum]